MAIPAVTLSADLKLQAQTTAERQIREMERKLLNGLRLGNGQPLGKLTGKISEFDKSLEAANARVVAFGASAAVIVTVTSAIKSMVSESIKVEKALADINVLLNQSGPSLSKFSSSLFDIAKNTGNTFDEVAEAAKEFSRQGLGAEETLKRTSDAMILVRLSGLDAAKVVETLTASMNGFSKEGLNTTEIINRLANVDARFAVSSKDLAEGLSRAGGSAQDAGVSFNELVALITTVQQRTARGGAVIGNALKSIFTRLQRSDTLDALEQLGIAVRDVEGSTLPLTQVLSQLAQRYDSLQDSQKSYVSELVGSQYQINILKALFSDLGQTFPEYAKALGVANDSTDEAIIRNQQLNKTLASLANTAAQNFGKAAAGIGKLVFGPSVERVLGQFNELTESFNGEDIGSKIGVGILKGIGNVLSGPGLIFGTFLGAKLFVQFAKFSAEAIGSLAGVGKASERVVAIQQGINSLLKEEPALQDIVLSRATTIAEKEAAILAVIRAQVAARRELATITEAVAVGLVNRGITRSASTDTFKGKGLAGGYIPTSKIPPQAIINEVAGAQKAGYTISPNDVRAMRAQINGKTSTVVYNTKEKVIHDFAGSGEPAIIPPTGKIKNYGTGLFPKLNLNGIELRPTLLKALEHGTELLKIAKIRKAPDINFVRGELKGELGHFDEVNKLINLSIPDIYARANLFPQQARKFQFDRYAGNTAIHELFHASYTNPKARQALEELVRTSPKGGTLPKKLNSRSAVDFAKSFYGQQAKSIFKENYKGREVEEVLALLSPTVFGFAGGNLPLLGEGSYRRVFDMGGGKVLSKVKSAAEMLATLERVVGKDPSNKGFIARRRLREITERPKIQQALGKSGLGPKVFSINKDGSYVAEKIGAPTLAEAQKLGLIDGALSKKIQSQVRDKLVRAGIESPDISPYNIAYNINSGRATVLDYADGYIPTIHAATGYGLETLSKAQLIELGRKLGIKNPRLYGKSSQKEAARLVAASKEFRDAAIVSATGRNIGNVNVNEKGFAQNLITQAGSRELSNLQRNLGSGAPIPGLTPVDVPVPAVTRFVQQSTQRAQALKASNDAALAANVNRFYEIEQLRAQRAANRSVKDTFDRPAGLAVSNPDALKSLILQNPKVRAEFSQYLDASRLGPIQGPQQNVYDIKGYRQAELERRKMLIGPQGAPYEPPTPRTARFKNLIGYKPEFANKYGTAGFLASAAIPAVGGAIASGISNRQGQRSVEGVTNAIGSGAMLASLGLPAIGALTGSFLALRSVIDNLQPSLEDLQEKYVKEAEAREKNITSLEGIQQASAQLKQGDLTPSGARNLAKRRNDLLLNVSKDARRRIEESNFDPNVIQREKDRADDDKTRRDSAAKVSTLFKEFETEYQKKGLVGRFFSTNDTVVQTDKQRELLGRALAGSINTDKITDPQKYIAAVRAEQDKFNIDANGNYTISGVKVSQADYKKALGESAKKLNFAQSATLVNSATDVGISTAGTSDEANLEALTIAIFQTAIETGERAKKTGLSAADAEKQRVREIEASIVAMKREASILAQIDRINFAENAKQQLSELRQNIADITGKGVAARREQFVNGFGSYITESSRNRLDSASQSEEIDRQYQKSLAEIAIARDSGLAQVSAGLASTITDFDKELKNKFTGKGAQAKQSVITSLATQLARTGTVNSSDLGGLRNIINEELNNVNNPAEFKSLLNTKKIEIEKSIREQKNIYNSERLQSETAAAIYQASKQELAAREEARDIAIRQKQLASLFDFEKLLVGPRDTSSIGNTLNAQLRQIQYYKNARGNPDRYNQQGLLYVGNRGLRLRTEDRRAQEGLSIDSAKGLIDQVNAGFIPKRDQIRAMLENSGALQSSTQFYAAKSAIPGYLAGINNYKDYANMVIDASPEGKQLKRVQSGIVSGLTSSGNRDVRNTVQDEANKFLAAFQNNGGLKSDFALNERFLSQFSRSAATGDSGGIQALRNQLTGLDPRKLSDTGKALVSVFLDQLSTQQSRLENISTQAGLKTAEITGGVEIKDDLTNAVFVQTMTNLAKPLNDLVEYLSKNPSTVEVTAPSYITIQTTGVASEIVEELKKSTESSAAIIFERLSFLEDKMGIRRPPAKIAK